MKITDITAEELRLKSNEEGMVFQGCGGDTKEWVDGINQLLKDAARSSKIAIALKKTG